MIIITQLIVKIINAISFFYISIHIPLHSFILSATGAEFYFNT